MIEPKGAPDHRHQCEEDCQSIYPDDELINLDLDREKFASSEGPLDRTKSVCHRSGSDGVAENRDEEVDIFSEPLGCQHFLYDVNIEYSPGGKRSSSIGSKHSFKLKNLPYMVHKSHLNSDEDNPQDEHDRRDSIASSTNSSNCCESDGNTTQNDFTSNARHVDVTKATCAFLGNSDYVPNHIFGRRKVVLELISAKLSQPTVFNVPANASYTNLVTLNEQQHPSIDLNSTNTNNNNGTPSSILSRRRRKDNFSPNTSLGGIVNSETSPSSHSSSKRFVNYTILIKTIPGLDKHPALIERRFSDFLLLHQSLKNLETAGKLVDRYVTFPKKVYMGNFSLTNIAERSIEFSRLLNLCMTTTSLLWSAPFIAFLLDKELKEAHKLSLCGDPDDVQVLIETVYHIERKLYLRHTDRRLNANNNSSLSSISLDTSNGSATSSNATANGYSPLLTNGRSTNGSNNNTNTSSDSLNYDKQISSNDPITNESFYLEQSDSNTSFQTNKCLDSDQSRHGVRNEMSDSSETIESVGLSALNQRVLVTFCMLFLTYYRGENYHELKVVVKEFSHLISSREYVDSIISTRYYMTLRACLLFLMNMNRGNIIDENQRLWLKRKLEDIDGTQADFAESINVQNGGQDPHLRIRRHSGAAVNGGADLHRILTKGDLMSLVRDRNFCSFQTPVVGKSNQRGRG